MYVQRILYFQSFCFLKWIIHILSSTSLFTENKGALVSKCRVQRSNCYVYYYHNILSTYLKHTLRYLARSHLFWCSVSAWDTSWVLDQPFYCIKTLDWYTPVEAFRILPARRLRWIYSHTVTFGPDTEFSVEYQPVSGKISDCDRLSFLTTYLCLLHFFQIKICSASNKRDCGARTLLRCFGLWPAVWLWEFLFTFFLVSFSLQ